MGALQFVTALFRQLLQSRAALVAENLALRQQVVVLQRSVKRPKLHRRDRIFWVWLSRLWRGWRSSLIIVQPETVLRRHREGFRLYWRWKSRSRCGRPKLDTEIRALIRHMSRENPTWGRRRIRSELHLLGYEVAALTVAKYMVRGRKPPSQGWRIFSKNHAREIAAIDFFTVVTLNFRILICFVVLRHHRRTVVHFNVTTHPAAHWTAQQIVEAFPYDTAPRYLLRDRDGIYRPYFADRVRGMDIEEVLIAPRSPWQNPFIERLIGSIRRGCLDRVLVINEAHLRRVLREYFAYYHDSRPHQSLDGNAPGRARLSHRARGGSWPSPESVVSITDTDALRKRPPASPSSRCQPAPRCATLGPVRQPRGLSENPESLAGLPIHPPIAGRSAEMASGRDDLIDRHNPPADPPDPSRYLHLG